MTKRIEQYAAESAQIHVLFGSPYNAASGLPGYMAAAHPRLWQRWIAAYKVAYEAAEAQQTKPPGNRDV